MPQNFESTYNLTCVCVCVCAHVRPMPPMYARRQAPVSLATVPRVNYRKALSLLGPQVAGPQWAAPTGRRKEEKVFLIIAYNRPGKNEVDENKWKKQEPEEHIVSKLASLYSVRTSSTSTRRWRSGQWHCGAVSIRSSDWFDRGTTESDDGNRQIAPGATALSGDWQIVNNTRISVHFYAHSNRFVYFRILT